MQRAFIFFAGVSLVASPVLADDVAVLDALAVIRANEVACQSVVCTCRFSQGILGIPGDMTSLVSKSTDGVSSNALLRLDSAARKYWVELESTAFFKVEEGGKSATVHGAVKSQAANDGTFFSFWSRGGFGDKPPTEAADSVFDNEGLVCHKVDENKYQQRKGFLQRSGAEAGVGWIQPYFWPKFEDVAIFSEYLSGKVDHGDYVRIRETDGETWQILVIANSAPAPYEVEIDYSPVTGRFARIVWGRHDGEISDLTWKPVYELTLRYPDLQSIVPKLVVMHQIFGVSPGKSDARTWQYTDVTLGKELSDAEFRVEFPDGLQVIDHVNSKVYVMGAGLDQDIQSVERFVQMFGTGGDPVPRPRSTQGFLWFAGANVLVMIIAATFFLIRRRIRIKNGASLLLLALVATQCSALACEGPESLLPTGQKIHDRQCGHLVAAFVLKSAGYQVSSEIIDDQLPVTEKGVSLVSVKSLFETYGMNVSARRGVTVAEIAVQCTKGMYAVVPILTKESRGHYLVAFLNREGVVSVADVLVGVRTIADSISDEVLDRTDGVVLFVSRTVPTPLPSNFISTRSIDLGEMDVVGKTRNTPLTADFLLQNGEHPTVIAAVRTSCGCAGPNWKGGILTPRETRKVRIDVRPSAWGIGPNRKYVTVVIGSGETFDIELRGVGVGSLNSGPVTTDPAGMLGIDVSDCFGLDVIARDYVATAKVVVRTDSAVTGKLVVTGDDSRLDVTIDKSVGTYPIVTVRIRLSDEMRMLVAQKRVCPVGSMRIESSDDSFQPQHLPIQLTRTNFVKAEPRVVHKSIDGRLRCKLLSPNPFEITSCATIPGNHPVAVDRESDGEVRFEVPDSGQKARVIRCLIKYSEIDAVDEIFIPVVLQE